jgi:hypothetical protein
MLRDTESHARRAHIKRGDLVHANRPLSPHRGDDDQKMRLQLLPLACCVKLFSCRLSIKFATWLPDRAPSTLDNLRQAVGGQLRNLRSGSSATDTEPPTMGSVVGVSWGGHSP